MNKKKMLRNVLFLLMSLVMVLTSVVGVYAFDMGPVSEDIIDMNAKASLTIYKYDMTGAQKAGVDTSSYVATGERNTAAETALANFALKGVEFTYLNVGRIKTKSEAGHVNVEYEIPSSLAGIIGVGNGGFYTSDEINAALAGALADNTSTKNKLENYIKGNHGTAMNLTNENGVTTATGLPVGLYLVVETRVPEEVHTTIDPFFVSLPMTDVTGDRWNYDVTVYPKNQTNNPTIDKLVSENGTYADIATASEGDVLDYRVVTKLPTITSEATYLSKYTFVDQLSQGIKYNKDTTIAIYESEADAKNGTGNPIATWGKGNGNFTVSYDGTANSMTVAMTSTGLAEINPKYTDRYLVVIYKATVNSDAKVVLGDTGNRNTVALTYSRTNTGEENTIKDIANVFFYGINLKKTFSDNKGDATKVQFVLQNKTDGYYVVANGSEGNYHVTDGTHGNTEAEGTVFSPKADGSLVINGLEADTYVLTEIHTSDGYSLLKEPITIEFKQTVDTITPSVATVTGNDNPNVEVIYTNGERASATVDGKAVQMSADNQSANARADMEVINTNSFLLPQTGGLGTLLFTILGACAVIVGIMVVTKKSKKEAK